MFRELVKAWNKGEVGNLEENINQIQKEIGMVQGLLMAYRYNVHLQKKGILIYLKG